MKHEKFAYQLKIVMVLLGLAYTLYRNDEETEISGNYPVDNWLED